MLTIPPPAGPDGRPPADGRDAAAGPVVLPPMVYLPCAPLRPGDTELTVDLRQTRDGRLALLVYSAMDRLVDCCGPEQPWTVLPATDLENIRVTTGFEMLLLDLEIPEEHRRRAGAA